MCLTLAFFTAASMERASERLLASGFSQNRCLPFSAAAMAMSAWVFPGVDMSTRSMSSRCTRRFQLVSTSSQPNWSAAACTASLLRPQRAFITGIAPASGKKKPMSL